jgi:branched-subunit amino acid aminotransferase/4-amino-4-deoxychorismate lyase
MSSNAQYVMVDGALKETDQPAVSATSRGLMYGDGCFETFCSYSGQFFKLSEHLQRLENGLSFLGIGYHEDLRSPNLDDLICKLLKKNDLNSTRAVVRLQVWREGSRGYATDSSESSYSITVSKYENRKKDYTLATVPIRRIPSSAQPAEFKFTNGINYITAARQALEKGADDALMQTLDGSISETTIANVFWMKNEQVYTPSEKCEMLPGVTRSSVINFLRNEMDVKVNTGAYDLNDCKQADRMWVCNSVKEIQAVARLDKTSFPTTDSFYDVLKSGFKRHLENQFSREV